MKKDRQNTTWHFHTGRIILLAVGVLAVVAAIIAVVMVVSADFDSAKRPMMDDAVVEMQAGA